MVELIVFCTTLGGAIHSVAYNEENFPLRNLPYLKSRCFGKEPYHFGSSDFFLLHLITGEHLFITMLREFVI